MVIQGLEDMLASICLRLSGEKEPLYLLLTVLTKETSLSFWQWYFIITHTILMRFCPIVHLVPLVVLRSCKVHIASQVRLNACNLNKRHHEYSSLIIRTGKTIQVSTYAPSWIRKPHAKYTQILRAPRKILQDILLFPHVL